MIFVQENGDGSSNDRWSLPDLESAVAWCRDRARGGIRCTLSLMTESAGTGEAAALAVSARREAIRAIGSRAPGTSFSIKPSSIGLLVDPGTWAGNLAVIAREAGDSGVPLEIDTEGKPLVAGTLQAALARAPGGAPVTIALQAYLDRTPRDLDACLQAGLRVRLVKGAYLGDTADFFAIQERFRTLAMRAGTAGVPFSAGTHDPDLVAWLQDQYSGRRDGIEFAFLKGLADQTKTRLAAGGWKVCEYVPFGPGGAAYRFRRERYLAMLGQLGRAPVP